MPGRFEVYTLTMLERYLGRKESPKISIESDPALEGSKKPLWENALKDPEFMKWFSGSVVSDSSGNPIPVFHGTRGPLTFEEVYKAGPTELGMHFGAIDAANTGLSTPSTLPIGAQSRQKNFTNGRATAF